MEDALLVNRVDIPGSHPHTVVARDRCRGPVNSLWVLGIIWVTLIVRIVVEIELCSSTPVSDSTSGKSAGTSAT